MKRSALADALVVATSVALAMLASLAALGCDHPPPPVAAPVASPPPAAAPLDPPSELCMTEGTATPDAARMRIAAPAARGFVPGSTGDAASLDFIYRGTTPIISTLASGDNRAQLGLKLRAADSCNVIYVMWRLEPTSEIVVQLKRNDAHTHAECGATGYTRVRPASRAQPPALAVDDHHALSAAITDDRLDVRIDDHLVWSGTLPPEALTLRGPAGLRTDNVVLDLALRAPVSGESPDGCRRRVASERAE